MIRAAVRILLMVLMTLLLLGPWALGTLLLTPWSQAQRRWRGGFMQLWARLLARIIGARIDAEGTPPPPGSLLVANHLSYLDVIVLLAQHPALFVAKSEVAAWPALGWLARIFGTLFIDRRNFRDTLRIQGLIADALAGGDRVVVFPEGTSSPGEAVLPFRAALLELAAGTGQPVWYAALSYRTPDDAPPAAQVVCWWGDMTFFDHLLTLLSLPLFYAHVRFGERPVTAPDRKQLAYALKDQVEQIFVPVDAVTL